MEIRPIPSQSIPRQTIYIQYSRYVCPLSHESILLIVALLTHSQALVSFRSIPVSAPKSSHLPSQRHPLRTQGAGQSASPAGTWSILSNWAYNPYMQKNIPALTPNKCRNVQLYFTCEPRNPEWETSVGDKCGRQVWEISVNSCAPPRHPEWETRVGNKWETRVKSCGPRHPEWETSVEDKCGR